MGILYLVESIRKRKAGHLSSFDPYSFLVSEVHALDLRGRGGSTWRAIGSDFWVWEIKSW